MSAIVEEVPEEGGLEITDISTIPSEPPAELFYVHQRRGILTWAGMAWQRRDVIFTLAERDIRAAYKQQVLGLGWLLIMPLFTLIIFNLLLHNQSSFQMPHGKHVPPVPYVLATYTGLWGWGFFSGALGGGTGSLIQNKVMMSKTHFPRECFPLSQIIESGFTSTIAIVIFFVLFPAEGYLPKLGTLWVPLYIAVEIPFVVGVVLLMSSVVVQARDLMQVMGMMTQFGMLASCVLYPFTKFPAPVRPFYSFINPLAPVIDSMKNSILLGRAPEWGYLGIAACGGLAFFVVGYTVFKKLEVNFADLT